MDATCSHCAAFGPINRHHPTGRAMNVPHHPQLKDDLCPSCHRNEHVLWRACELEMPATHSPICSPLVLRFVALLLRRLALWLGRRTAPLSVEQLHQLAEAIDDLAWRLMGVTV